VPATITLLHTIYGISRGRFRFPRNNPFSNDQIGTADRDRSPQRPERSRPSCGSRYVTRARNASVSRVTSNEERKLRADSPPDRPRRVFAESELVGGKKRLPESRSRSGAFRLRTRAMMRRGNAFFRFLVQRLELRSMVRRRRRADLAFSRPASMRMPAAPCVTPLVGKRARNARQGIVSFPGGAFPPVVKPL